MTAEADNTRANPIDGRSHLRKEVRAVAVEFASGFSLDSFVMFIDLEFVREERLPPMVEVVVRVGVVVPQVLHILHCLQMN